MKKKIVAVLMTAAMTASLLAGCGSKESAPAADAGSTAGR